LALPRDLRTGHGNGRITEEAGDGVEPASDGGWRVSALLHPSDVLRVDAGDREPVAEAHVEYGVLTGLFVRLDVRLEDLWDDQPPTVGAYGWAALTPEEAEALAASLTRRAREARARDGGKCDSRRTTRYDRRPRVDSAVSGGSGGAPMAP
jgi:hypothetical protein